MIEVSDQGESTARGLRTMFELWLYRCVWILFVDMLTVDIQNPFQFVFTSVLRQKKRTR